MKMARVDANHGPRGAICICTVKTTIRRQEVDSDEESFADTVADQPQACTSKLANMIAVVTTMISYFVMAALIMIYVFYFFIWEETLSLLNEKYGGIIDMTFFKNLAMIVAPLEVWILLSSMIFYSFLFKRVVVKNFHVMSHKTITYAIMNYNAAFLFCAFNGVFFITHDYMITNILRFQNITYEHCVTPERVMMVVETIFGHPPNLTLEMTECSFVNALGGSAYPAPLYIKA